MPADHKAELNEVFPARAGMIPIAWETSPGRYRIPRESGDDPLAVNQWKSTGEYSPRERG